MAKCYAIVNSAIMLDFGATERIMFAQFFLSEQFTEDVLIWNESLHSCKNTVINYFIFLFFWFYCTFIGRNSFLANDRSELI